MSTVVICRTCGGRAVAELATNQQELASVGMLEQSCFRCNRSTFWGLAENYRLSDRRGNERRRVERRHTSAPVPVERRRHTDRRTAPVRQRERRHG